MKSLLRLFACIGLFTCLCRADDLNAKATSEQFLKLRMAYATGTNFAGGWVSDPARESLLKFYETDPKNFISKSGEWLKKCPVDAKVHLMLAGLLLKAGDTEGHFYHRLMYYGLTTSIVASGDGKTAKTAYKVISIDEEYTVMNHIGAKLTTQTLQDSCDVMQVEIEGTPLTLYFDVSIPLAAQQRQLDKKSK